MGKIHKLHIHSLKKIIDMWVRLIITLMFKEGQSPPDLNNFACVLILMLLLLLAACPSATQRRYILQLHQLILCFSFLNLNIHKLRLPPTHFVLCFSLDISTCVRVVAMQAEGKTGRFYNASTKYDIEVILSLSKNMVIQFTPIH